MAFEQEQTGTTITNRHYVSAMGQAFLMLTSAGTHTAVAAKSITDRQWWHRDHLGSIASITNASYVVTQRFSYDPFGKRRDITGSYDANGVLVYDHPTATDRGFTGHEHLDDVGIIHMNGRLYDPRIGRFLQADPYIQRHDNTQSYNRYSYVLNNPLNATDPSGQIAIEVFYWAAAAIVSARAVGLIDTRTARQLLGLLVTAYIAGMDPSMLGVNSCSAAVDTTFIQAVAGGIAGGAVSCGADCAGMAGASAITFFAIGQWANGVYGSDAAGQQATGRAIAHGVGGCITSVFQGGKCGQGAATAFLGKAITSRLDTTGYLELDIARAGVIGGTLSSIGGGKFANGAMMGAFQYLFNQALSGKPALHGDPFSPGGVEARTIPQLEVNPQHAEKYLPGKTPLPKDAAAVYDRAVRVDNHVWIAKADNGTYYRYFEHEPGKVHFSGALTADQVRQFGYSSSISTANARAVRLASGTSGSSANGVGKSSLSVGGGAGGTMRQFNLYRLE
jgi:RHS repeat-associated protein